MTETYPMKYLKVEDGFIALVWALERPLEVSQEVLIGIGQGGIEARTGEVVLPILDSMLPDLLKTPRIQVSFMTEEPVDDNHIMVNLDLPQLYEMKGALTVLRNTRTESAQKADSVVTGELKLPDSVGVVPATSSTPGEPGRVE